MAKPKLRYAESDMEWPPLEAIIGTQELDNWMWMHCATCPDNGATVHFYKHIWSRRYLRLDGEGHVYKERGDGTPIQLPSCGGGTLVLLLVMATADVDRGVPAAISLPEVSRQPCTVDDLPDLADIADYISHELWQMIAQLEQQPAPPSHSPL